MTTARRGDPTVTYTGKLVWPLSPRAEDVDVVDIAHNLAISCRYGNSLLEPYSNAEHSIIMSLYVPEPFRPEALLHDADEFIIPDMVHGLKHSSDPAFYAAMEEYRQAGRRWLDVIFLRFGVTSTTESRAVIKEYDNRIVLDETAALSPRPEFYRGKPDLRDLRPLGANIAALPWRQAQHVFLRRFAELFPHESPNSRE